MNKINLIFKIFKYKNIIRYYYKLSTILILYIILKILFLLIKIFITYIYYILYMPKNTTFLIKNIYLIVIFIQ